MLTALAAGALVLSTVALVVAAWSVRARTVPLLGTAHDDSAQDDDAGWDRRRLEFAEAAARCATADELAATVVHAVSVVAPRAGAEVRLGGLGEGNPEVPGPTVTGRCPVPDIDSCPAVRHATVVTCADSRGVDACPWLAGRPGVTSAVCAPVAVDGRGVGYVHVSQPVVPGRVDGHPPGTDPESTSAVDRPLVDEVTWLAAHLGTRLGTPVLSPTPVEPVLSPAPVEPVLSPAPVEPVLSPTPVEPVLSPAPVEPVLSPAPVEPVLSPTPVEPVLSPTPVEPVPSVVLDLTVPVTQVPVSEVEVPTESVDAATGWSTPPGFLAALGSGRSSGRAFVLVLGAVDDLAALADRVGRSAAEVAVAALGRALVADPDPLGPATVLACSRLDEATVGVAWSDLTLGRSVELIEVVRSELLDGESDGSVPACRRSFGLTHSSVSEDPQVLLATARAGLDRARSFGGDQIVYADLSLLEGPPTSS